MKKIVHASCLVLSTILLTLGCGKDDSPTTPEEGGPDISSFSPTSGPVGTEIFITGKNFGSTVTSNTVKIGNTTATVSSTSTTELFITVPNGAATGKVSVTVGGKTDTGGTFTVTQDEESNNVALSKTDIELFTLDSETLSFASGVDANTHVDWSSNDESVAIVDDNGKITGVAAGSTTITATVGDNEVEATVTINPNIYVTGYKEEGDMEVGELWINGVAQNLINASDIGTVFVNGMDVYVAGQDSNGEAVIWKNNKVSNLTSGAESAMAQSVFVLGEDVYAAGHNFDDSQNDVALVWKNDVLLYELTNATTAARAYSIFVDGTDTYVAGYERTNSFKDVAKIWKNGIATNLTDGSHYADSRSMFVVDTDVYVLVLEENNQGGVTKVLKNGTLLYEITDESPVIALSLFVLGADIYVAGFLKENNYELIKSKVWKNNQVLYELEGSTNVQAYSIYVK